MSKKVFQEIAINTQSRSDSAWWIYFVTIDSKDIDTPKMKKIEYPKKLTTALKSFYKAVLNSWDSPFTYWFKYDKEIYEEFNITFENKECEKKILRRYGDLSLIEPTHWFWQTINKYRNTYDFKYSDWYVSYKYIDTMWNEKEKKETILSFMSYMADWKINPAEYLPQIECKIVMSNKLEDKLEILEHHWFNGSCQRPGNCDYNAQWYHDMYYNGGMCVIKMYIWEKFCWRSLARLLYDKDLTEYLLIDRIYRIWLLWNIWDEIYHQLFQWVLNKWYKVLSATIRTAWPKIDNLQPQKIKPLKEMLIWPGREIFSPKPYTYYNNSMTQAIKTNDWFVYDTFNGKENNLYQITNE